MSEVYSFIQQRSSELFQKMKLGDTIIKINDHLQWNGNFQCLPQIEIQWAITLNKSQQTLTNRHQTSHWNYTPSRNLFQGTKLYNTKGCFGGQVVFVLFFFSCSGNIPDLQIRIGILLNRKNHPEEATLHNNKKPGKWRLRSWLELVRT